MNTFSNFGGTWPKFFVLEAVDYFTKAYCSVEDEKGTSKTIYYSFSESEAHDLLLLDVSCVSEEGKTQCKGMGGTCIIEQDGYYIAGTLCVALGALLLFMYIKPVVKHLESLSKNSWRLNQKGQK